MSAATTAAVKAVIALLSDPKARKAVGWIIVAILSPLILLVAFLCCLGTGAADHNSNMVDYCFFGTTYSGEIPPEFEGQMTAMRSAFASLDSAAESINGMTESGNLDPTQLKAVYYVLCSDGSMAPGSFTTCFYTLEERTQTVTSTNEDGEEIETEESYTVAIPNSLSYSYQQLAALLGRQITEDEKVAVQELYTRIAGNSGESYDGIYLRGSNPSVELDTSVFTNPSTKNATDLVAYAMHAWNSGWGYVWGTFGDVLTESLLEYKVEQYPDGVGQYESFIRTHWLGGRVTDCVGLIKGYGWLDPDTLTIRYGTNGMPDIGANAMYQNATVKGSMDTMPDIPGLAVWMDGHIGVYIGNSEVVEASSTRKGVIKTQLAGRGWTHWLEVPYINYS